MSSLYHDSLASERLHGGSIGAEGSHGGSLGASSSYGSSMSSSMSSYSASMGSDGSYGASVGSDGSFDGLLTAEESHRRSAGPGRSYSSSFTGSLDYNELARHVSENLQSEYDGFFFLRLPVLTHNSQLLVHAVTCSLPLPFLLPVVMPYNLLP